VLTINIIDLLFIYIHFIFFMMSLKVNNSSNFKLFYLQNIFFIFGIISKYYILLWNIIKFKKMSQKISINFVYTSIYYKNFAVWLLWIVVFNILIIIFLRISEFQTSSRFSFIKFWIICIIFINYLILFIIIPLPMWISIFIW
jgi:hypothetical protein